MVYLDCISCWRYTILVGNLLHIERLFSVHAPCCMYWITWNCETVYVSYIEPREKWDDRPGRAGRLIWGVGMGGRGGGVQVWAKQTALPTDCAEEIAFCAYSYSTDRQTETETETNIERGRKGETAKEGERERKRKREKERERETERDKFK